MPFRSGFARVTVCALLASACGEPVAPASDASRDGSWLDESAALDARAPGDSADSADPPDGLDVFVVADDPGGSDASDAAILDVRDVMADVSVDAPLAWSRDWSASPAVALLPPASTLYAVSDVHGGYARLTALLARHGILSPLPASPAAAHWAAGTATLVVVGDLIDKGPQGLEVLDFLRALQLSAAAQGGHVAVTLGNHEAEFLVNPRNNKATAVDGVDPEILAMGLVPEAIASTMDPRGRWLRALPFAARVGGWFFAHAGDTHGRSVADLESVLRAAVEAHDYNDPEIVGTASILESRDWYLSDPAIGARYATALAAGHIVFGHDPNALGSRGSIAHASGGALFRIDCGMSPGVDYSTGVMLRVRRVGSNDIVEDLHADGSITNEWTGPAS